MKKRKLIIPLPILIGLAAVMLGGVGVVGALNGWFGGGSSIPTDTMTRDLVGYWSFEEGSGTAAYDASGYANSGTVSGARWVTGKVGGALDFDGIDDYVSLGNPASLQITDELTIEFWVKLNSTQVSAQFANPIGKDHSGTEGVTLQIDHTAGSPSQYWHIGNGSGLYSLNYYAASLLDDTWHQLVVTKSLISGMAIYLDGVLQSKNETYTQPIVWAAGNWEFGRLANITSRVAKMVGDELRIYNRALSATEVRYHYNRGGPVAHWKMDEGSGSTVYDSTENNNDGTIPGSIQMATSTSGSSGWVAGKYGTALSFDGVDDYVQVPNSNSLNIANGITISAWVELPAEITASPMGIVTKGRNFNCGSDNTAGFTLIAWDAGGGDQLYFQIGNGTACTNVAVYLTVSDLNKWTHIVAIRDVSGGKLYLYKNGALVASAADSGGNTGSTATLYIGSANGYGSFNETIDEVRIYNYVRTVEEIRLDYNAGFAAHFGPQSSCDDDPGACMTDGLVGYWDMEEGTGGLVHDRSGNSTNGTLSGGATWAQGIIPGSGGKSGGGGLSLDGTSGYATMGTNSTLDLTNTGTIETWVKINSYTAGQYPTIIGKGGDAGWDVAGYSLWINSNTAVYGGIGSSANQVSFGLPSTGVWHHLIFTWDGNYLKAYIDGVQYGSSVAQTANANSAGQTFLIGKIGEAAQYLNGKVDEIRVYNRALSPAEVRYHYNRGGPVGYWKFDEGSGRTAYDSTPNNNDGTLVLAGSATSSAWVSGKYGSALSFDGVDDYVQVPHNTLLNFGDGASFSMGQWVKTTQTGFGVTTGKINWTSMNSSGYQAGVNNGYARIELQDGTGNYVGRYASTNPVNDGKWHHVDFVRDGDIDIYIYIDGVRANTTSAGISLSALGDSSNTQNTTIGMSLTYSVPTYLFNGLIDDVRIYNYARSPSQIQQDYNAGLAAHFGPKTNCDQDPGACMTEGLVGYWDTEEGTGTTIHDRSGNSTNGTLSGGATWAQGIIPGSGGKSGGGGLSLDGTSGYATMGTNSTLDLTNTGTIETWVKINSYTAGQYPTIIGKGGDAGWDVAGYSLWVDNAAEIRGGIGSSANQVSFGLPSTGVWHHLIFTWDGNYLKAYIDGVQYGSSVAQTANANSAGQTFLIGKIGEAAQYLNGKVDEIRVYNRALSAEEVRYHYNGGGPVAHWKMDEGEGSVVYDSTEKNNDGTLSGAAWSAGQYGSALSFDGVDDYLGVANSSSLEMGTKDFTLEAWFKAPSTLAGWGYIISKGHDQGGEGVYRSYYISLYSNGLIYGGLQDNTGHSALVTAPYTVGKWQHVVIVADRDSLLSIYVDGVLKGSSSSITTVGNIDTATVMGIGSYYNYVYAFFRGLIDDVRIYNYVRTPEQIRQDYNAGLSLHFK